MSYPQPDPQVAITNGYQYFRLNTPLSSPGDIYESAQGAHALAVGPDSDIANIKVVYLDQGVTQTAMNIATISPRRALVGLTLAQNDATYAPAQRTGRLLFYADDIYDPSFRPRAFTSDDAIDFAAPVLDVIEYFDPLGSLGPARPDKTWFYQNYIVPSGHLLYLVVPFYGRRYAYINFTNRNNVTANTFGITAVNYAITDDATPNPYHQETTIRAAASVAVNGSVTQIIRASTTGVFDALIFSLTNSGPAPLRIVTSDDEPT